MATATSKKLESFSNYFYNDGLEKAGVRDLSGAIESLQQSLRMDKNNIDARNLLGLIYYETGEVVAALSEWVISKNLRPEDNIADEYMDMVRNSPAKLEDINQTIKKFNIAYNYCHQDSMDLAVIQLKKVLSLNPSFIKAHLLLALLYLKAGNFDRAKNEAKKVLKLDTGNLMARRYLKEADSMLIPGDGGKLVSDVISSENDDIIRYNSGNEMIIQPRKQSVFTKSGSIWGIVLGIVLGIAASCFLILPQRIASITSNNDQKIADISEISDSKTAQIGENEQTIKMLKKQVESLKLETEGYSGSKSAALNGLMKASSIYMSDPSNIEEMHSALDEVDLDTLESGSPEEGLRDILMEKVGAKLAQPFYKKGIEEYKKKDYENAVKDLAKAYQYNKKDVTILYNLANSYKESGMHKEAKEKYDIIIREFPNSQSAASAKTKLAEINNPDNADSSEDTENTDNAGNNNAANTGNNGAGNTANAGNNTAENTTNAGDNTAGNIENAGNNAAENSANAGNNGNADNTDNAANTDNAGNADNAANTDNAGETNNAASADNAANAENAGN